MSNKIDLATFQAEVEAELKFLEYPGREAQVDILV
jgi:hypothetical protein